MLLGPEGPHFATKMQTVDTAGGGENGLLTTELKVYRGSAQEAMGRA